MTALVLLRHGQSVWNAENRFTGWADVDLSERGRVEAKYAGELLAQRGIDLAHGYASVLKRAVTTLNIVLEELDRVWMPVTKDWRLNERHYGDLTGLNKADTAKQYGAGQVAAWRRSFDIPPPPISVENAFNPNTDPHYRCFASKLPQSESLKTTSDRVLPYFEGFILPRLRSGENVIVSAHGNSLRALAKMLFRMTDDEIVNLEIPTGNPLLIELDGQLGVRYASYLDQGRASPLPMEDTL